MKKKLAIIMATTLLTVGGISTYGSVEQAPVQQQEEAIIHDGTITYFQMKEIIVENFLYTLDLAKHHQVMQEAENVYDEYSFECLEKAVEKADKRLDSITGPENELQIVECLNMQIELTRCISQLVLKEA